MLLLTQSLDRRSKADEEIDINLESLWVFQLWAACLEKSNWFHKLTVIMTVFSQT